jgi:glucose-1-phosphate thymidylyltransferase
MLNSLPSQDLEIIALIPAAGRATRLSPLPASKELYPLGFRVLEDGSVRPKVVSHYLLEKMRLAGIEKAYMLLRPGKWDIPAYFGDGAMLDMNLGYLVVGRLDGVQYSIDHAYPFVKHAIVAVGYPDILLQPEDIYKRMLDRLLHGSADVVIGAVPFSNPQKGGMITYDVEDQNKVSQIIDKPEDSTEKYSWCCAVWRPSFTAFLHHYLAQLDAEAQGQPLPERPLGDMIQAGIDRGLRVEAELIDDGGFLDIGTPEDLAKAIRELTLVI